MRLPCAKANEARPRSPPGLPMRACHSQPGTRLTPSVHSQAPTSAPKTATIPAKAGQDARIHHATLTLYTHFCC